MQILDFAAAWNPFTAVRQETSSTSSPAQWFLDLLGGGSGTDSGIKLNGQSSLKSATIWQGVSVIAGDVGQLPLDLYKRTGEDGLDKEIDRTHSSFRLMRRRSHPAIAASVFRELLQLHTLIWGNGIAEIQRDNRMRPLSLTPLQPWATRLEVVDNEVWYVTVIDGKEFKLRQENVFHVLGLSFDGLWGIPVWEKFKNSVGLGLAGEKFSNVRFKNNARPGGVLEHPGSMKPDKAKELAKRWASIQEGLDNVDRTAVLEEGMKYKAMGFDSEQSQLVELREFQVSQIASWFNLPPHKVNQLKDASFTNTTEQNLAYLNQSLMRWLVKWQDEADEKLLTEQEKEIGSHFFEFNTRALSRGDLKGRSDAYRIALAGQPYLTVNEVRRNENKNGVDGGDEIKEPLNMANPGGTPRTDQDNAQDAAMKLRSVVHADLTRMVSVECNRVREAAKTAKNFNEWVESFYNRWRGSMGDALQAMGGTDEHALEWCRESEQQVDDLTGRVNQAELSDELETLFLSWKERVDTLTDEVTK